MCPKKLELRTDIHSLTTPIGPLEYKIILELRL